VPLASGFAGDADALPLRARARVLGAKLRASEQADYPLAAGRYAYLVPARGAVELNGVQLEARDGAAIRDEPVLQVTALEDAELVLVDVPA
jgi:redox-sensitive bicupin YhaK (pirin superfamily)